jgi:hypothetical protein
MDYKRLLSQLSASEAHTKHAGFEPNSQAIIFYPRAEIRPTYYIFKQVGTRRLHLHCFVMNIRPYQLHCLQAAKLSAIWTIPPVYEVWEE